ncbi:olfactory receptor 52Z1P-like [Engraulis encrasicolus]|uniref:olfactory receptor 52Z1P-like n=1 Tax=Engraulis encrasicolus TaxID=184585 RepID=UPI002FCF1E9F
MDYRPGNNSHKVFYLTGFTSLGEHRRLLSIPFLFLLLYMTAANGIVTFVIATQKKLHEPMYLLIGSLTLTCFFFPMFILPRMVISFASGRNDVRKEECLIQMFLVHWCGCFQSSILLQMAVDRFFAICWPLRYHSIVNLRNSIIFTAALAFRNTLTIVVKVGLFIPLTFCHTDTIYHCLCEHTSLVKLGCGNVLRNYMAGTVAFALTTSDCILIALTYIIVFIVIFTNPSGESRQKAIHTCTTHLTVICVAYSSVLVAFIGYRVPTVPPDLKVLSSLGYLLIPSSCNPIIYGMRTKEIKVHVIQLFKSDKVDSEKSREG